MVASAWPPVIQRVSAARSPRVVKQMFSLGAVGMLIRTILPALLGVMALAFAAGEDPARRIALPDGVSPLQAMPLFLCRFLPAGLIGIVAAGILSALLSTIDSYLLCWSTVLTQDVLAPCLGERITPGGRIAAARGFIVLLAGGLLVAGVWWPLGEDLWSQLALAAGAYFAGAVPVLVLGLYWRRASRFGAYLALGTGLGALAGVGPVLTPLRELLGWDVHAQTIAIAAAAASVIAMVAGSLLVPDRQPKVLQFPEDPERPEGPKTE
jgi:SSS family solute:Na+ symporter